MRGGITRFEPAMDDEVREERLTRWCRAVAAARLFVIARAKRRSIPGHAHKRLDCRATSVARTGTTGESR